MRGLVLALVSVLVVFFVVPVSYANNVVVDPQVSISWQDATGAGGQWSMAFPVGQELRVGGKEGSVSLSGADNLNKYGLQSSGLTYFNMAFNTDPYITGGFAFINGTLSTQTYTIIFQSPVTPAITPSTLYGGSMSGSFTADPTAAMVTTTLNTPLYWGMIDGSPVLPIYNDPSSWSAAANASGTIAAVNMVPPTLVGPAANNNISIQFKFTLTPGDTATMNGAFVVIPEPATLALLGLGGLLMCRKK